MKCGAKHPITGLKCGLPAGHAGDHTAQCFLKHCGGYRSSHIWPNARGGFAASLDSGERMVP